jgi:hypothetical protein
LSAAGPRSIFLSPKIGAIAYQNKAVIYDLLFKASAKTLLTIAADPKRLGVKIGNSPHQVCCLKTFIAPELRTGYDRKDTFLTNPTLTLLASKHLVVITIASICLPSLR